jgi:hypothetical protein
MDTPACSTATISAAIGDPNGNNKLTCHRKIMDDFIQARQKHCFGELHDYFDHPQCIGWMWTGDADHPDALAVLMSTGDAGFKKMTTGKRHTTFRDLTGHWPEPVTTDENGEAEFQVPAGECECVVLTSVLSAGVLTGVEGSDRRLSESSFARTARRFVLDASYLNDVPLRPWLDPSTAAAPPLRTLGRNTAAPLHFVH